VARPRFAPRTRSRHQGAAGGVRERPGRLARFEREAKVLASLNHANIASIYGVEEAAQQQFLVLELVEGETLAERLSRGAARPDAGAMTEQCTMHNAQCSMPNAECRMINAH